MIAIETQRLKRVYGERIGIESVDLSVQEGDLFGFLGPNGAGKTTTIRVLMGLLPPSAGGARILGLDCWKQSVGVRRHVGYLPGDLRLYSWLTVRRALAIGSRLHGRDLRPIGRRLAEQFQLDERLPARKMSKGMREKLGLLMALAHQPKVLVLDEPTSGLDPLMQERLKNYLRDYAARGNTVFFSSHSLSEVEHLCRRVAMIRRGRIVSDTTIDELRSKARRRVRLVFARPVPDLSPPGMVHIVRRTDFEWEGELTGNAARLVEWAAAQPLHDIDIGRPDLESMFQRFYDDEDLA